MNIMFIIWMALLAVAVLLIIVRFMKGPVLQDRVIALDMFTTVTSGLLVLLAHKAGSAILLDISLVYAVLAFASVLVIARFLDSERRKG